jgi:hypothetical protein
MGNRCYIGICAHAFMNQEKKGLDIREVYFC